MKTQLSPAVVVGVLAIVAVLAIGLLVFNRAGGGGGAPDTERLNPDEASKMMQAPPSAPATEGAPARSESQMPGGY